MEVEKINNALAEATRAAFEAAWARSRSSIEISKPSIEEEGIEYLAELYDPFSGTVRGRYIFCWEEITDVIRNPSDISCIHESVSEWISVEGETVGGGELMMDDDGRVHFRSDLLEE